ncbi:unnamed protein product [Mesocestoides corti]|uniref:BZIP domain-containing protein n=1 Tax=Mesocestoides corti TaxID=53468 RepID=A0A0R3UBU0_MESCO|nr:unnamed protein product [Mesocestoides corti]
MECDSNTADASLDDTITLNRQNQRLVSEKARSSIRSMAENNQEASTPPHRTKTRRVCQKQRRRRRHKRNAIARLQEQTQQTSLTNNRQPTITNNNPDINFRQPRCTCMKTARCSTWRGNERNYRPLVVCEVHVRGRVRAEQTVWTSSNVQLFLEKTRAFIQALKERRHDRSLFVDVPQRSHGISQNAGRARFRR